MRRLLPVLAFGAVLAAHAAWHLHGRAAGGWISFTPDGAGPAGGYLGSSAMWLGLSYATAAAFAVFSLTRCYEDRRRAMRGAAGGLALTGLLYWGGCFLLGCCGSPMLTVYLGLFGPRFAGVTGPLMFAITVASVAVGYVWMVRRRGAACACGSGNAAQSCCSTGAQGTGDAANDAYATTEGGP